ncbi:hypothetical protein CEUSTIGMA_g2330.t1 [Chlamydomonas eustigma]|uniref:RecQ-mediated genome instability protein 1 n=1 Tax=Chlamydomonas eustigma TaxID=1157962 RepID=A0A250WVL8_9CHLO|nr:hypothetical protein CEUSTIGMA_g2330.t1 [Chlamydomonas eustigma]|eukprot:GAX74884.1 hypothetical protein CEUSTIGMA_g2330.t1 [Chlamydomonas eustigma]
MSDIHKSGQGSLPEGVQGMHYCQLPGRHVLQVDEVVNTAAPAKDRYTSVSDQNSRMLKLHMSDGEMTDQSEGVRHVMGIEYKRLHGLSWESKAGLKVAVQDVPMQCGVMILQPQNLTVLGGQVHELEAARQKAVCCWNKAASGRRPDDPARDIFREARAAAWAIEDSEVLEAQDLADAMTQQQQQQDAQLMEGASTLALPSIKPQVQAPDTILRHEQQHELHPGAASAAQGPLLQPELSGLLSHPQHPSVPSKLTCTTWQAPSCVDGPASHINGHAVGANHMQHERISAAATPAESHAAVNPESFRKPPEIGFTQSDLRLSFLPGVIQNISAVVSQGTSQSCLSLRMPAAPLPSSQTSVPTQRGVSGGGQNNSRLSLSKVASTQVASRAISLGPTAIASTKIHPQTIQPSITSHPHFSTLESSSCTEGAPYSLNQEVTCGSEHLSAPGGSDPFLSYRHELTSSRPEGDRDLATSRLKYHSPALLSTSPQLVSDCDLSNEDDTCCEAGDAPQLVQKAVKKQRLTVSRQGHPSHNVVVIDDEDDAEEVDLTGRHNGLVSKVSEENLRCNPMFKASSSKAALPAYLPHSDHGEPCYDHQQVPEAARRKSDQLKFEVPNECTVKLEDHNCFSTATFRAPAGFGADSVHGEMRSINRPEICIKRTATWESSVRPPGCGNEGGGDEEADHAAAELEGEMDSVLPTELEGEMDSVLPAELEGEMDSVLPAELEDEDFVPSTVADRPVACSTPFMHIHQVLTKLVPGGQTWRAKVVATLQGTTYDERLQRKMCIIEDGTAVAQAYIEESAVKILFGGFTLDELSVMSASSDSATASAAVLRGAEAMRNFFGWMELTGSGVSADHHVRDSDCEPSIPVEPSIRILRLQSFCSPLQARESMSELIV